MRALEFQAQGLPVDEYYGAQGAQRPSSERVQQTPIRQRNALSAEFRQQLFCSIGERDADCDPVGVDIEVEAVVACNFLERRDSM